MADGFVGDGRDSCEPVLGFVTRVLKGPCELFAGRSREHVSMPCISRAATIFLTFRHDLGGIPI